MQLAIHFDARPNIETMTAQSTRLEEKKINKQNKKTLAGQHKCYEIYEKSYFLYFIKKRKSKSPTQNKTSIRPHWIRTY